MVLAFTKFTTWTPKVNLDITLLDSQIHSITDFCELYHLISLRSVYIDSYPLPPAYSSLFQEKLQ